MSKSLWTEKITRNLIYLRAEQYSNYFITNNLVKTKLMGWKKIKEQLNTNFTLSQIYKKWRELIKQYKEIKVATLNIYDENLRQKEESWTYFDQMDSFLKDKYNINKIYSLNSDEECITKLCGEIFATKDFELTFKCQYCCKLFTNINEFSKHLINLHYSRIICDYDENSKDLNNDSDRDSNGFKNQEIQEYIEDTENLENEDESVDEALNNKNIEFETILVKDFENENSCPIFGDLSNKTLYKNVIKNQSKTSNHIYSATNKNVYTEIKFESFIEQDIKNKNYRENNVENKNLYNDNKDNIDEDEKHDKVYLQGKLQSIQNKLYYYDEVGSSLKTFQCVICNKLFKRKDQLKRHSQMHIGVKPFECNVCGKSFAEKSNLKVHNQRHFGEKKHQCSFCDKSFVSLVEKKSHERIHSGEKPYLCNVCGKTFTTSGKLTLHKNKHIGKKTHECITCGMLFYSTTQLKEHSVKHTNLKPFECKTCNAKFSRKGSLRVHLKLHSDTSSYECKICWKKFKQNAGLYSHMKTHKMLDQDEMIKKKKNE